MRASFWGERSPLLRFAKEPVTRKRFGTMAVEVKNNVKTVLKVRNELSLTWRKCEGAPLLNSTAHVQREKLPLR